MKEREEKEMKQKEIKRLVATGEAIDLTHASEKELNDIRKNDGLEVVAHSFGVYGMNAGLFKGYKSGNLYAVTCRNSNLFTMPY